VRKTRPKLGEPFKVYIYETKDKNFESICAYSKVTGVYFTHRIGKVIGEFVCDDIIWSNGLNFVVEEDAKATLKGTCLTKDDIYKYIGLERGMSRSDRRTEFYRWRISNLVIYDKPKELSEFGLTRPPQSWCYVKEDKDEKQG
jgi:predicted transcriptional regulator